MSDGYFIPPTVITDLKDSSRCMQEEIFGPVVSKEHMAKVRRYINYAIEEGG